MFVEPMLLEKIERPFDDERYLFEPKIDGHRLLLSLNKGKVTLYTRHSHEVTRQYPELHNVPVIKDCDVILDGEVARMDEEGWFDFELIMERFRASKSTKIREYAQSKPVHYYVFDILYYNGEDVRSKPLWERKLLLQKIMQPNAYYSLMLNVEAHGKALFDLMKQRNLGGIVAKKRDSKYVGERSSDWLKIINYTYVNVELTGYRKNQFGWLAQYQGKTVGVIEFAVPSMARKAFYSIAQQIKCAEDRDFVYIQPPLKAQVRTRNWTKNGMLRTPEFVDFVV
ncbi:DNA ligase-1 [Paenibacillus cellulosilyticus]|uniref:DNA ligase-1 n=1 Tax=Paenibacillus cellulosilyticus TaxID=375489 RepID=A0A2V2YXV7_9BACL|nr:ATP-dependent DNA ligase [Paenibacillus cellulosilyticus]PWW06276.1 DNA ligase-1 [Paenibacillus cellulosilyticus]QKS42972.1 ATP-dependent DNA ligase [Paenibacillus cellulosilyticus]